MKRNFGDQVADENKKALLIEYKKLQLIICLPYSSFNRVGSPQTAQFICTNFIDYKITP